MGETHRAVGIQEMAIEDVGGEAYVVDDESAYEHSGGGARQSFDHEPGVFQGLPGDFEYQALLRVEAFRLPGRDPEEQGVHSVDGLAKISAMLDVGLAGFIGIRIVEAPRVPTIRGNLDDAVAPLAEHFPKGLGGFRVAGEAATHADDGDRVRIGSYLVHLQPPESIVSFPGVRSKTIMPQSRRRLPG
uniref:Uncharacterized protein n=1 Tax=Candidatus Kentrum sp. TC TaxID=2126339 RepID=A0A450Y8I9_9GAMM|nr:MAG: hypothetical protein BECKTC1821E_GA0114239_1001116 [Candidatus Kentron sp. TC]